MCDQMNLKSNRCIRQTKLSLALLQILIACTGINSIHAAERAAGDAVKKRHFRADEATRLFAKRMPAWSKAKGGVQLGVSHVGERREFHQGERLPLQLYIRNVSNTLINVKLYADFFWFAPTVRDEKNEPVSLERFYVNGVIADISYHQTLQPGEALVIPHPGLGLGERDQNEADPWASHPFWKKPAIGKYSLAQTHKVNLAVVDKSEAELNRSWATGKYVELTTGKIKFTIADRADPAAKRAAADLFGLPQLPDSAAESARRTNLLLAAIRKGDLKQVQALLDDDQNNSPIQASSSYALSSPSLEVVEYLVGHWKLELSALQLAVIRGDAQRVTKLLERQSVSERRVELADSKQLGHIPSLLHLAALHGHVEVIKELVRYGGNANDNGYHDAHSPLAVAAENGHVAATKTIIRVGAKVDLDADYTALMRACVGGKPDTARVLLEFGADPNLARHDGQRALHLAAKAGSEQCVKLLLKHGADPLALAYGRDTALSYAQHYKHEAVVQTLKTAAKQ